MFQNSIILDAPLPHGGTQRDALMIARPDDERLKPPQLNRYDAYLFHVFWQLNRDRVQLFQGIGSIPLRAFVDYQALFQDVLWPDEVSVLQRLDRTYIAANNSLISTEQSQES